MKKFLRFVLLAALLVPIGARAQITLPYSNGFEDAASIAGWRIVNFSLDNADNIGIFPDAAKTGNAGFQFSSYTYATNYNQYLISPEISATTPVLVGFSYSQYGSYAETFAVGYSTTDTALASFIWVDTVNTLSGWHDYTTTVPADARHVAIHYFSNFKYYLYVDDFFMMDPNAIPPRISLPSSGYTNINTPYTITATRSMGDNVTYAWSSLMGEGGTATPVVNDSVLTITYTATGIDTVMVIATNSNGADTARMAVTVVDLTPITEFPYATGFEEEDDTLWVFNNGSNGNEWWIGSAVNNTPEGSHAMYISADSGATNTYVGEDDGYNFAYRYFTFTPGQYIITYDWHAMGYEDEFYGYQMDYLYTFLGGPEDNLGVTGLTPYTYSWTGLSQMYGEETWQSDTIILTVTEAGNYPLIFAWYTYGYGVTNPPAAIDNISIVQLTCPAVTGLTVDTTTNDSIYVSWHAGGEETAWLVSLDGEVWTEVADSAYAFGGLTANTPYTIHVAAFCDISDTSLISTIDARTECGIITNLPWFEDFDQQPSDQTPFCWTNVSGDNTVRDYESMSHSGAQFLDFRGTTTGNMVLLPPVSAPLNTLSLNFWTRPESFTNNYCGTFSVGYVTDLDSAANTFVALQTYTYSDFDSWEQKEINLDTLPATAVALAFRHNANSGYYYWYVDDVTLYVPATCDGPTAVTLGNATTTSLTATVTGTATTYRYMLYNMAGTLVDTAVVAATTHTFSDLTPGTQYKVQVSAVCADGSMTLPVNATALTNCVAISELPYVLNLNALQEGANAAFDPCWSKGTTITTNYPYVTSNGGKCILFYSGQSYDYSYAIMPELDEEIAINTLELSFDAKHYSSYGSTNDGHLTIGVIDGDTYTAATPMDLIATVDITTDNYTTQYVSFANYEGSKRRIILLANGIEDDYNYAYVKNVNLHLLPSCAMPQDLAITEMTDTSVTLTWTGEAEEYTYIVTRNSARIDSNNVTTAGATITGLVNGYDYIVKVQSVCEESVSAFATLPVHIGYCNPSPTYVDGDGITNVTFGMGAETVNSNPTYMGTSDYEDHSDLVGAALPGNAVNMSLTFETGWAYGTYIWVDWNKNMLFEDNELVYTGESAATVPTTLVASFNVPATQDTGLYRLRIVAGDLDYIESNPCFSGQYACALDYTLHVTELTGCMAPMALAVTGATDNSVSVVFTGVPESSYVVSICDSAATTTLAIDTIVATTYTFTGLTSSTWYTVFATTLCDEELTDSASVRVQTTVAGAPLPYGTGFETADDIAWTISNDDNGWYIDTAAASTGARSLYISADSGVHNIYSVTSPTYSYAYKTFTFGAGTYAISFDWRCDGEGSDYATYDYLKAMLVPASITPEAGSSLSGTGIIDLGDIMILQSEWQTSENIIEIPAPATYHLVFFWQNDESVGTQPPAAVDNVAISAVTCLAPDSLKVLSTTTNSVTLDWHPTDTETLWAITLNDTAVVVNAHPATINGLTSGTYYTARVRAICAAGDTSFAATGSFWTGCSSYDVPYVEDFSAPELSPCWTDSATIMSTTWKQCIAYGYNSNGYIYSTTGATNQNGSDWLISPVINIPANTTDLNLAYMIAGQRSTSSPNAYARYEVYVSPNGGSSFADFTDTLIIDTINSNIFDRKYFPMTAYANHGIRVAIRNTSFYSGTIYLANFGVRYTNQPLYGVSGSTTAFTHDTISWKAHYIEGDTSTMTFSWSSTMAAAGQGTLLNGTTDSASMVYTAAGVDTMMFIATNSYGADTTVWYVHVYDCGVINTFPYTEDFESTTTNPCYVQVYGDDDPSTNAMGNSELTGTFAAHSGTGVFRFSSMSRSSNYNQFLISPEFGGNNRVLSFWHAKSTSSTTLEQIRVGYSTTNRDTASFTWGQWITPTYQNWNQYVDTLDDEVKFVAIQYYGNYAYYVYIDDFTISGIEASCEAPVIDSVVMGETTAQLYFTSEVGNYEVAIVPGEWQAPTTGTIITATNYTFTGLTAETQYTVGVRSLCDDDVTSTWVTRSVTTDEHPCLMPTHVELVSNTLTSAVIDWTPAEAAHSRWAVKVTGTGFNSLDTVNTHPYTVNGLTANTDYSVQVMTICSDERGSEFTEAMTFVTIDCQTVTGVNVSNVTSSTAVVSWDAVEGSTGRYEVNYGTAGFPQGSGSMVDVTSGTTVTLTGLDDDAMYDVYVRTYCAENVHSLWSAVYHFSTLENGIDDVTGANIALYPNPAHSTVTLTGIEGEATVTVVDMNGRVISETRSENGKLTLDVSGMAQGAYFVRITGEQVNAIRKLIVR